MMDRILKIDSAARQEFDEAFDWYAKRSAGAAIAFAAEIDTASDEIMIVAVAHLKRKPGYWRYR